MAGHAYFFYFWLQKHNLRFRTFYIIHYHERFIKTENDLIFVVYLPKTRQKPSHQLYTCRFSALSLINAHDLLVFSMHLDK